MRQLPAFSILGAIALVPILSTDARAVRAQESSVWSPHLQVATGAPVRRARSVVWDTVPTSRAAAWRGFQDAAGLGWRVTFDRETGVPGRIFGEGIPAPNTIASADAAEAFARQLLAEHIDLFAPGASPADFVLVANDLSGGMRSIGFRQTYGGLAVIGGQVSFRIKNDRVFVIGSEALPYVSAEIPGSLISQQSAKNRATDWLEADTGVAMRAESVTGPFVLPLVRARSIEYRAVLAVVVRSDSPVGRWTVYVDAATGDPVARRQTLHFADGVVRYDAPERRPGSTRLDYPAPYGNFTVNGANVSSDNAGNITWAGSGDGTVTTRVNGTYVNVLNDSGAEITGTITVPASGTATWDRSSSELDDAQLASFIHANRVKEWARGVVPAGQMPWLDDVIQVTVNINDQCNAFSDGDSINFFVASNQCENTGRLPDVVYHEFGHSFHAHAIIEGVGDFDGSQSEGIGDFLAATIVNDSGMGRGFFFNDSPLREIGSPDRVYPDDVVGEVHEDGIIYAGAMWDLRENLINDHGMDQGVQTADYLFYESIRRTTDMTTAYAELLAADDDNGNVADGTPNYCSITEALNRHGLAPALEGGPGVQRPELEGMQVTLPVVVSSQCPGTNVDTAELVWQRRGDPSTGGTIPMASIPEGYEATIPAQPGGTVVNYQVRATLQNGNVVTYPDNPADPMYELFVGEVVELYCTDFEGAEPAGWTHGLTSGTNQEGADDWQWGTPSGRSGSGDPAEAYSGVSVYGNDLGLLDNWNGNYQPDKVNFALSPTVDTGEYTNVRLQYRRWLNVEDATYDNASIYANDQLAWRNLATPAGTTNHTDREWRFHDVDISGMIEGNQVAVKFEIASDPGLELGGWTIDDFCVVAYVKTDPVCGDGVLDDGEECDDGNGENGDGCENDCTETPVIPETCGDGVVDAGEECDDGNGENGDGCENDCTETPDNPTQPGETEGGCGCRAGGNGTSGAAWIFLGAAVALVLARRRRG